jgi:hypothetical protein
MDESENSTSPVPWICAKCGVVLQVSSVSVSYLGSGYPVDLLKCPKCGQVLVPEEMAVGKMAEVERILEDK